MYKLFLATLLLGSNICLAQRFAPTKLKTEYLVNPIGLDSPNPRFTWQMADVRQGAKQTAFRVLIASDSSRLLNNDADIWNSGWKDSEANLATFLGRALKPFTKYYWKVELADANNVKSTKNPIASFEMGMMNASNWQGSWIADSENTKTKPAPYFRRVFESKKAIKSARAYVACGGLFELSLNGEKVGNHSLDPNYTRFDRRTLYVTYDVTSQIKEGKNAVGVTLGNGWYNHQSTAVWNFHNAPWRNRPTFCMDLRITYTDGSTEVIKTDREWKTALSPIIFNSIYTAEHYDSRLELPGWNTVNFDDAKWRNAYYRSAPSKNIVAQVLHPIRNVEEIKTKTLKKFNDTDYVFDLGRNIAGVSKITLSGDSGTIVKLKHGERLYENGHVDLSNIDVHYRPTDDKDPFQVDIVILNGKNEVSFMPKFNYKGFQYVEVTSSKPVKLAKENLIGYFMHSDVPTVGSVKANDDFINKLHFATNNSYLSNLFGYPTDCPQREKNGWTGDAVIANETGLYSFDGITVYEKWMADHRDEQQPNGVLPSIIPTDGWGYEWGNGPDWTSTIAVIPWNLYLFYGDLKPLKDNYENIKLYVDHINQTYPEGTTTWGLGDWVPVKSKSPVELTSTCYYYADVMILAKTAKLLGKFEDEKIYLALANKIKNAFNNKFLKKDTGIYGSGLQTELSVPLYWGIVPDDMKKKVAENLAKRVEADNFHLDVGLLGTKAILSALSDNGYGQIAYKIASQKDFPSWGWWIQNGATTLYENWDIKAANDISLNHIMFGEIGAWLFKGLGGIKPDEAQPGFKNVIIDPVVPETLNTYEAKHESGYGEINVSWKRSKSKIEYSVVIPANSTASFVLRGDGTLDGKAVSGERIDLTAGKHLVVKKI